MKLIEWNDALKSHFEIICQASQHHHENKNTLHAFHVESFILMRNHLNLLFRFYYKVHLDKMLDARYQCIDISQHTSTGNNNNRKMKNKQVFYK